MECPASKLPAEGPSSPSSQACPGKSLKLSSRPAFCAAGLFSHNKAEAVIQQLFDTVSMQQKEILRLSNEVAELKSSLEGSSLNGDYEDHKDRNNNKGMGLSFKERLERLEKFTMIQDSQSVTLGEVVNSNRKALAKALHALSSKANSQDLIEFQNIQGQRLNDATQAIRDELVSKESILGLSDSIIAINDRLDVISSDLQNKVEKATFRTIQMDANLIRERAKSFRSMEEEMDAMKGKIRETEVQLNGQQNHLAELATDSEAFKNELTAKVSCRELSEMNSKVENVFDHFERLAGESTEARDRLLSLSSDVRDLYKDVKDLTISSEDRWKRFTDFLRATYTKDEVANIVAMFVRNSDFDSAFSEIKDELKKKAWDHSVFELRSMLEELVIDHASTKRTAALATKFIDWYGRRGESYEHNMQAIDNQLKRLTKSSIL